MKADNINKILNIKFRLSNIPCKATVRYKERILYVKLTYDTLQPYFQYKYKNLTDHRKTEYFQKTYSIIQSLPVDRPVLIEYVLPKYNGSIKEYYMHYRNNVIKLYMLKNKGYKNLKYKIAFTYDGDKVNHKNYIFIDNKYIIINLSKPGRPDIDELLKKLYDEKEI